MESSGAFFELVGATWSVLGRILAPLDFEVTIDNFRKNLNRLIEKGVQEGVLKQIRFWDGFLDAKMGSLEMHKQAFCIINVGKHEFSGSHEIYI